MRTSWRRWLPCVAVLGILLSACSGNEPSVAAKAEALGATAEPSLVTSPATAPVITETSTTEAPTTTTTIPKPTTTLPGLGAGAKGPEVLALQQRLDALKYWVGTPNGVYSQDTVYAVTAFQKVTGMARTGRATDDVLAAMEKAPTPAPLVAGAEPTRVEVDLPRQVLFLYEGNGLSKILPVSTGNMERFCSEGYCRIAGTPTGAFKVYRQDSGWNEGPLGSLYNAQFIVGGIAIHGSNSVPAQPASHGCIRIPMTLGEYFQTLASIGDQVFVFDGVEEPESYDDDEKSMIFNRLDPNYTTTTSSTIATTTLPPPPPPAGTAPPETPAADPAPAEVPTEAPAVDESPDDDGDDSHQHDDGGSNSVGGGGSTGGGSSSNGGGGQQSTAQNQPTATPQTQATAAPAQTTTTPVTTISGAPSST